MTEFLAVDEPCGLLVDVRMVAQRRGERIGDTLAVVIAQRRSLGKDVLRLLPSAPPQPGTARL